MYIYNVTMCSVYSPNPDFYSHSNSIQLSVSLSLRKRQTMCPCFRPGLFKQKGKKKNCSESLKAALKWFRFRRIKFVLIEENLIKYLHCRTSLVFRRFHRRRNCNNNNNTKSLLSEGALTILLLYNWITGYIVQSSRIMLLPIRTLREISCLSFHLFLLGFIPLFIGLKPQNKIGFPYEF